MKPGSRAKLAPPGQHQPRCRFRIAHLGAAGIECQHGFDACPVCDPCTCDGRKAPKVEPPKRVRLERRRGYRMPYNTKKVARPTRWGNTHHLPVDADHYQRAACVMLHRYDMAKMMKQEPKRFAELIRPLRGFNVGCFCLLTEPCHGDTLLELANATPEQLKKWRPDEPGTF